MPPDPGKADPTPAPSAPPTPSALSKRALTRIAFLFAALALLAFCIYAVRIGVDAYTDAQHMELTHFTERSIDLQSAISKVPEVDAASPAHALLEHARYAYAAAFVVKDRSLDQAEARLKEGFDYLCDMQPLMGQPPCSPQAAPGFWHFLASPWMQVSLKAVLSVLGTVATSGGSLVASAFAEVPKLGWVKDGLVRFFAKGGS